MKTFFQLFLILCITGCNAQTTKKKMAVQLSDKEIKEQGYRIKKKDTLFMNNGILDIAKLEKIGITNGTSIPPNYQYEGSLDENTYIFLTGSTKNGYGKTIKKKGESFQEGYSYHPSGHLKAYGVEYVDFFQKGIWYEFDEKGDIEEYKNHDAPYTFTWENILEFLEIQKIKKEEIIEINRSNYSGDYQWSIVFKNKELLNTDNQKVFTLDGKTGEILNTEIIDAARHLD